MNIYVSHSTDYNFKDELYQPIIDSPLYQQHQITLPHITDQWINSKGIIKNTDLVIAEVSFSSTGLGIELGWASYVGTKIVCIFKQGSNYSRSLTAVTNIFLPYSSSAEMIEKIAENLSTLPKCT